MSTDRGPSWWDVGEAARYLMETYDVAVEFALVPPIRRLDGKGYSSWVAVARVRSRGQDKGWSAAHQAPWGKSGSLATAPAALNLCLAHLMDVLDKRQKEARAQARF